MKPQIPVALLAALLTAALAARAAAPLTPEQQAVHVLNRIAFGPKPGEIAQVAQSGVQNYIEAQLHPETIPFPPALAERLRMLDVPNRSAGSVVGDLVEFQKQVREEDEGAKRKRREGVAKIALETAEARMLRAIDSPRQLEEAMVDFWFNHFNVFADKGIDRALIASYERDAIRPYVFGSFRELLGATAHHPAMLYYLDNYLSASPDYVPGAKGKVAPQKAKARGLNENYARELMELHTLGVDGGYTQKDVTELARMLTGWTYEQRALVRNDETFRFETERHDHGVKTWLGREIADQGQREGEYALDVLAMHPSTAHHLSYKLAQYFVEDNPPPALVERMARTYLDSKGDIRSVLRTLFASAEFMAPASVGAKFKTPYQFVVSAARASATPITNIAPLLSTMGQLGMPLYGCQTPDGYKNTQDAWLNPDALTRRITFATALAGGKLPLASAPPSPAMLAAMYNARQGGAQMPVAASALQAMPAPAAPAVPAPATSGMPAAPAAPIVPAAPAAPAAPALDAAQLRATLGGAISERTQTMVAASPEPLRAAMLLGSPDFMQR